MGTTCAKPSTLEKGFGIWRTHQGSVWWLEEESRWSSLRSLMFCPMNLRKIVDFLPCCWYCSDVSCDQPESCSSHNDPVRQTVPTLHIRILRKRSWVTLPCSQWIPCGSIGFPTKAMQCCLWLYRYSVNASTSPKSYSLQAQQILSYFSLHLK
jgi:hypothetical protein